jgi:CDP-diacylglycerol--serine O-phosphatidyltransferase
MIVNSNSKIAALIFILPAAMPVCAALRLAIFNIDTTQTSTFKGMPTPANALAVISVILAGHYSASPLLSSVTGSTLSIILFTMLLSLLMVSSIPLLSLKAANFKFRGNEGRYILICLVIISFLIFGIGAAPMIIPIYLVASLLSLLF